jgi:hypothetical protein
MLADVVLMNKGESIRECDNKRTSDLLSKVFLWKLTFQVKYTILYAEYRQLIFSSHKWDPLDRNLNSEIVVRFRSYVRGIIIHWKKITSSKPMYRTGSEDSVRTSKHGKYEADLRVIISNFLGARRSCLVWQVAISDRENAFSWQSWVE